MGLYTRITRRWLERRFAQRAPDGVFVAHQPVYGIGHPQSGRAQQLPCVLRILKTLDQLPFASFLDVGGAEGFIASLVRSLYRVPVVSADLSHEACQRARELFAVPAVAIDCARLPFQDQSFDVVLCSEVLEHVEHPVETLLELCRVARKAVILTTEEMHHDRAAIDDYLFQRPGWPHMERNRLHVDDVRAIGGPAARLWPEADRVPPDLPDEPAVRTFLQQHCGLEQLGPTTFGVVVLIPLHGTTTVARTHGDAALIDALLSAKVPPRPQPPAAGPLDPFLLQRLREPRTGSEFEPRGDALCAADGSSYPVRGGVPDLWVDDDGQPRERLHQRLQQAFPDDPARAAALLQLRDRLWLPDRVATDRFDFRDREQRRGFGANEQLVARAGGTGFAWASTGSDPWLLTPCLQRKIHKVTAELRIHNPAYPIDAGTAQLFWKGPDDDTFGEDRCVSVRLRNDGAFHDVVFDLSSHPRCPSEIEWLRLDPVDGPAEVDLRALRLE